MNTFIKKHWTDKEQILLNILEEFEFGLEVILLGLKVKLRDRLSNLQ
ncbi:hypothetical protein LRS37_04015 [Neobacillus sedimentimangrovi]|jgi:hypothetical protein|uniref:Uncharacterized protein n=1 Tax=Neobacillus sedimentimangrovi TaxID=2699460 RepID=A0ABS8QGX5_9BACI|nr:hypothetical protein [Neobacillus sedimentimangrovi]MED3712824.1 hypothetical protein [Neobacillus thermocopriae]